MGSDLLAAHGQDECAVFERLDRVSDRAIQRQHHPGGEKMRLAARYEVDPAFEEMHRDWRLGVMLLEFGALLEQHQRDVDSVALDQRNAMPIAASPRRLGLQASYLGPDIDGDRAALRQTISVLSMPRLMRCLIGLPCAIRILCSLRHLMTSAILFKLTCYRVLFPQGADRRNHAIHSYLL